MMRILALLLLLACGASAWGACPQVYNGVAYPCSVVAGTVSAGVYRKNVNTPWTQYVAPRQNGRLKTMSSSPEIFTSWPSALMNMQMLVLIDVSGNSLLLIHAKQVDTVTMQDWALVNNHATAPCVNAQWCARITFRTAGPQSVDEVTFTGTTDWRVAAQYYKEWARQQSWYVSHGALAGQKFAHMMECGTNAYTYYQANLATIPAIFTPGKVGCYMTQYRQSAFDVNYPDYACSAGANCAAWLQALKDTGNAIGFPYINGSLWDATHAGYSAANMCLDSGGSATVYSGNLRYVDPKLATWPATLRSAFDALQATDGSRSGGVYLDVAFAAVPQSCHYTGTPDYAAWATGMKTMAAAFTDRVVMAEGVAEVYIPYVDIAYMYPPTTNTADAIGLYGFVYGDVPNFYIVGMEGNSTDTENDIYRYQYEARTKFYHKALLLEGGVNVEALFGRAVSVQPFVKSWSSAMPQRGTALPARTTPLGAAP